MMDLGSLIFEVANVLLLVSWLSLAFMLWRVRQTRVLNGGECPVIATLLGFATVRFLQIFNFRPWEIPVLMAVICGLTVISTVIIINVLHRLARRTADQDKVQIELPKAALKLFAELKNGRGGY